jgi:glycogen debranching enzyme
MSPDVRAMRQFSDTAPGLEAAPEARFYIASTGPESRPRRTLKHGDTFIVVDTYGDIGALADNNPDGLFHADTRHLSRFELLVNDHHPLLLDSNIRDDNAILTVDLTNPDFYFEKHLVLQKDTVHIFRTMFLWRGVAYQRIGLHNYGDRQISARLSIPFDSDFADIFEVRGLRREQRGIVERKVVGPNHVSLTYRGLDNKSRQTALIFDPAPAALETALASYAIELLPGESRPLFVTIDCTPVDDRKPQPFMRGLRAALRDRQNATRDVTTVETSNDIFNEVLCRSMADLNMLMTDTPEGPYPYAGIPWYSTTFGRDGLITALQLLWLDPSVARGVLKRLAAFQAKTVDPEADAEPGKILHEMRSGEMAVLHEVPFGLYYGSVDSTPLFVLLAGLYFERTGDEETLVQLWPSIEAALGWIDGPGDLDRDGFVEYERVSEHGLANQGWKDSQDAIFHADGSLAHGHIALAEVQGYVYAAKLVAARCASRLGRTELARRLESEARRLGERFEAAFWCPELETYALALDGEKKPCRVRTSNAGQVLFSEIAAPDRAAKVAEGLLKPQFFSGWGIRTVANCEVRYNPMSYHNGSVWPHDNALITLGFARYGLKQGIEQVFSGLFAAATYMEFRRLPELFCGFQRARSRGPTLYPVACTPQAWASAAPLTLLNAALGFEFDPQNDEIRLRNPYLPKFLDEVVLRNLRLGPSTLDVKLRRHRGDVSVEVLESRGKIELSILHSL